MTVIKPRDSSWNVIGIDWIHFRVPRFFFALSLSLSLALSIAFASFLQAVNNVRLSPFSCSRFQLYDKISTRVTTTHRLSTSDAVARYRDAADVLRELPRSVRDGSDVRELRDILANPFLKVSPVFLCITYAITRARTLAIKSIAVG